MSEFKCEKCNKILSGKQALQRHKGRKFPCKVVSDENNTKKNQKNSKKQPTKNQPKNQPKTNQNTEIVKMCFSCKYCKMEFTYKNNLYTHLSHLRCKKMPKIEMKIRGLKLKNQGLENLNEITKNKMKSLKI